MVKLHAHAKGELKGVIKKLRNMDTYMRDGRKSAIMYCGQCHMPSIEERTIPLPKKRGRPKKGIPKALREATELTVKWCVFCEEPVQPKVRHKKEYIALVQQLDRIYKGLRKNV